MNCKFGVTQWGLPGNGLYAVRLTKEAGLDGLQIELGSYERGYPMAQRRIRDAYMEDAAKYGIEFPSLVLNDLTVNGFVHGRDCDEGKIAFEQMRIGIEVAAEMNVKVVMIPNFFNNFITEEEHFKNAAEALKYCCDLAGKQGIDIATETVLNWKDHSRIFDMVNMPNLSVFFDSMNYKFFSKYDQMEILKAVYPKMLHQLHVKDGIDHMSGSLLGEGDMDFFNQMDYLKEKDYSGWIIIENYYDQLPLRLENEDDQLELLIRDLETLKKSLSV